MIFALGPALAPIIGGWVHVWFGWRAVFGSHGAAIGSLVLLLVLRRLPETHPVEQRMPLHLVRWCRQPGRSRVHPQFLRLTASSCLCFIALHIYIGAAPAIILDHWQLDETSFAALTLPIIGGYVIGAYFSGPHGRTHGAGTPGATGYSVLLARPAMMLAAAAWSTCRRYLQQLLLAGTAVGLQLMFPIVTLRIFDLFPDARRRRLGAGLHQPAARHGDDGRRGALAVRLARGAGRRALRCTLFALGDLVRWALRPTPYAGGLSLLPLGLHVRAHAAS